MYGRMHSRWFPLCILVTGLAATGCAEDAAARRRTVPERASVAQREQAALEAARNHPIARPEPRSLYPEQAPPPRETRGLPEQAPPPREPRTPTPGPSSSAPESAAPSTAPEPAEPEVVAPQSPPAPYAEQPPPAPAPSYVWAPGYWYWYDRQYVWISGAWLPPRPGYVFVSARWVATPRGWVFAPGGWALGTSNVVVVPWYRHRHLYPHHHHHYGYHPNRSWYSPYRSRHPHPDGSRFRHDAPRRVPNRTWVKPGEPNRSTVRPHKPRSGTYSRPFVRPQTSGVRAFQPSTRTSTRAPAWSPAKRGAWSDRMRESGRGRR